MKLIGKLEVFKNNRGYVTCVIKDWGENKEVLGKAYIDVLLPKEVEIKDGQTLTLDVEEAYLNARSIHSNATDFTKLQISVVKCTVTCVYDPAEEKKPTKKGGKR